MANPTQAPTLEKGALTPTAQAAAASAAEQDRLMAAFRFGWSLEELVWWLNSMAAQQAAEPVSTPASTDYPPDLTHQRSPAERIRELHRLLQVDGPKLVGDSQSVSAGTIGTRIDALLQTYEQKGSVTPLLTGDQRIGSFVRLWDADVVDAIIDQPPEILTAYELGKALSLTSWQIGMAQASAAPAGADPVAGAWQAALNKDRVAQIRRHLTTLATSMDPQIVVSVSASLSFWRRAYELGDLCGSATPNPANPIPADADGRAALQTALDQQLANWYDLLTGRRRLDSFPVTGVVSSLMRDYAQTRFPGLGPGALLAAGILVVVVVVGVPALEVPEQALDEAARAARGDQLQTIVVDHHLLAPRRLRQECIDGGLQAGLRPPAGSEQVVSPHRLANGKQHGSQQVRVGSGCRDRAHRALGRDDGDLAVRACARWPRGAIPRRHVPGSVLLDQAPGRPRE